MMIRFLCPNGHKIHCPDGRAGQAAKCPKCGVKFRIPELSEIEPSDSDSQISGTDLSVSNGPDAALQTGDAPSDAGEQIEFLCPNGHQLHGPASLQGQPGQCPECGAKFRIPSYDNLSEEAEERPEQTETEQISLVPPDAGEDSAIALNEVQEPEDLQEAGSGTGDLLMPAAIPVDQYGRSGQGVRSHPLADLFCELWDDRSKGTVVELHLSDGETIVPDRFDRTLSGGSVGVFVVDEADGKHTLTAVTWESVSRIQVRGIEKLPKGLR